MSKHQKEPARQTQDDKQQVLQQAEQNRQRAEENEVAGRHKNDGQKDHKGADKGPRGQ